MKTSYRSLLIVPVVMVAALLGACEGAPKGSVSEGELKAIRAMSQRVAPGQKKVDVMAKYDGANVVRLSSTQLEGATIEEWKAEAFYDSKKGRDLSVQFLYFRDDLLVDVSDSRLDFRTDAALAKRWSAGGK